MPSSVSSTLSAGAELLTQYSTLLPGPSESDVSTTHPDHAVAKSHATSLHSSETLSGSATSAHGDTVELSAEAMQMLQQLGYGTAASHESSHAQQAYATPAAYESIDVFA